MRKTVRTRAYAAACAEQEISRQNAGFSMVELLVSVAVMSVMTAVLLQSFIVARRLNARVNTEQKIQALAETTMESMRAAEFNLPTLLAAAKQNGTVEVDGILWHAEPAGEGVRLYYNDIGNGRGPVISFGKQYGVAVTLDPSPYMERQRPVNADGNGLVAGFNTWETPGRFAGDAEKLVRMTVTVYRMEDRLAVNGPEQLSFETARTVNGIGGGS